MKIKNIFVYILFSLLLPFLFMNNTYAIYTEENIGTYEEELANFPDSFKTKIEALHEVYPNAIFVAQDKFFDWNLKYEVPVEWSRMMSSEYYIEGQSILTFYERSRNLVWYDAAYIPEHYRSYDSWAYNYYTDKYTPFDTGNWYAAAYKTIEYYLDARNWLDENNVFMFESLYYHEYQTADAVEKILPGYMQNKECPGGEGKTFAQAIIDSANANSLSAYYIAARLKQEQSETSPLISGTYPGYEGYYNYFNVGATGNNNYEVIINGLQHAKNAGWDSPYKSIVEGAAFVRESYIGANDQYDVKGQLTLYLNKWDPYGWRLGGHQYMQNITAPVSEAATMLASYKQNEDYKSYAYIFYIPVYKDMPESTSLPKAGSPNNYLKSLSVNGTGVTDFDGAKTSYTYTVSGAATDIYLDYTKVNSKAKVTPSIGNVTLTGDTTKITVRVTAENGDIKDYELTIVKSSTGNISVGEVLSGASISHDDKYLFGFDIGTDANVLKNKLYTANDKAVISIKNSSGEDKSSGILATGDTVTITSNGETKTFTIIIYGDLTGNGTVDSGDLLRMRQHLIGTKSLQDPYLKAANVVRTNNTVDSGDLLRMRQHLLNKIKIEQS